MIEQKAPDGAITETAYNEQGLPAKITNALGQIRTLFWDEHQRLVGSLGMDGVRMRYAYDEEDRIVEAVTQDRRKTGYRYDALGRLTAVTDPAGFTVQLRYNALDLVTAYTDATGASTRFVYGEGLSQLTERVDAAGRVLRYAYDSERNLIALTNAKGESYRLGYDLDENLIEEVGFDGRTQRYAYDEGGQLTALLEAQGTTRFERDALGRLHKRVGPSGEVSRFAYDPLGRLLRAENTVSQVQLKYDPLGRIVQEQQHDQMLSHRYDLIGRRVGTTTPNGDDITYHYDPAGRLTKVEVNGEALTEHRYDHLGQEVQRTQGHIDSHYDYDVLGRLQRQSTRSRGGNTVVERFYRYDAAGKLRSLDDARRGQTRYVYDPSERLLSVSGLTPEQFVHDPAGNLLGSAEAQSRIAGDRLQFQGDRHFVYDEAGNRIEERRGKGQALVTRYAYDDQHRLVRVIDPKGAVSTYTYDALGRRIAKRTQAGETRFVYDGPRLLAETSGETSRTYLFELGSFRPLARLDRTGSSNSEIYYYHLDHLGTPQEMTSRNGRLVWSARYRAYGSLAMADVALIDNPLRFQGQYYDAESGLHYNLHRVYDPGSGSFLTQDPIGLAGGVQLYQYVPNPVGWVDPWGLVCKEGQGTDRWIRSSSSIQDQMTLEAARKGGGVKIIDNLNDPKFKGMEKWEYKVKSSEGRDSVLHYVRDPKTGELMDFKFKKQSTDGLGTYERNPNGGIR